MVVLSERLWHKLVATAVGSDTDGGWANRRIPIPLDDARVVMARAAATDPEVADSLTVLLALTDEQSRRRQPTRARID